MLLIFWNLQLLQQTSVDSEMYTTILHGSILKSIQADKTTEVETALNLVKEAQAELRVAEKLCGGHKQLSRYTNNDTSRVENTLVYQERQIRASTLHHT